MPSPRKTPMPQPQNRRTEAFEIPTLAAGLSALVLLLTLDLERDVTRTNREAARLRLAVAALASAWAPMLTLVAGLYAHPLHWKYVQPFAGGAGFVVMQAAGWMLHASTLCAFLVSFMNFDKALKAPQGTALVLGAAAATSSPSHPKPTMPPSIMVGAKVEQKDEGNAVGVGDKCLDVCIQSRKQGCDESQQVCTQSGQIISL